MPEELSREEAARMLEGQPRGEGARLTPAADPEMEGVGPAPAPALSSFGRLTARATPPPTSASEPSGFLILMVVFLIAGAITYGVSAESHSAAAQAFGIALVSLGLGGLLLRGAILSAIRQAKREAKP